ncbi:hypothetical protein D3C78_1405800 [compost metagenome]
MSVDSAHLLPQPQFYATTLEETRLDHRQRVRTAAGEKLGQVYPVVSRHRLFTKHHNVVLQMQLARNQLFQEVMTDHAVTGNHQNGLVHIRYPLVRRRRRHGFAAAKQQVVRVLHRLAKLLQIKRAVLSIAIQHHAL